MKTYSKGQIASFDIDPQNTFTPVCPDELPVPEGNEIVAELEANAALAGFRIGSKDAHSDKAHWVATEDKPQFSEAEGDLVDIHWNQHAVVGTKGFDLIDGLPHWSEYNFFVWKGIEPDVHVYGACYHKPDNTMSTGVIEFIKANGIETVICGGLATDYCVKNTVLQLLKADINVVLNMASCRGIDKQTTIEAVREMVVEGATVVRSSREVELFLKGELGRNPQLDVAL